MQAFGKIKTDVRELGVDLLSISGHKLHAPKGIGVLYVKKGVHIAPFMLGGGQEGGFRSGTESTANIVGLGEAVRLFEAVDPEVKAYLKKRLAEYFGDTIKFNSPEDSVDSILNVAFSGCRAEVLLHMLEENDIYVSTGSACSSNSRKKGSHVLRAMGLSDGDIEGSIRFSFSRENTPEQMDRLINILFDIVNRHRRLMSRK